MYSATANSPQHCQTSFNTLLTTPAPPPSSSPHIGLHYKVHLVTYSITRANPARTHTHTDVTLISDKRGDTRLPPLLTPPTPRSLSPFLHTCRCRCPAFLVLKHSPSHYILLYPPFFFPSSELDVTKRSGRI